MLINKYLNYNEILSYNMRHNFIVGDRGIGKTYGLTKWLLNRAINHNEPFAWLRNSEVAIKELTDFNGMGFLADHCTTLNLELTDFLITKGKMFYQDKFIGVFLPLSKFYQIKGINFDNIINFAFDEFMPEKREIIRINYSYALQSILQSVFRKRINFRAFYLSNTLKTNSNILEALKFKIVPHFENQVKQINKKMNAIIFYLQNLIKTEDIKKQEGDILATLNVETKDESIIDYTKNIDKDCAKNIIKKELIMYVNDDNNYYLLREYKSKIAVLKVKNVSNKFKIPKYAMYKKYVFEDIIYDEKIKKQLEKMWYNNTFVFKNEYTILTFKEALFRR